MTISNTEFDRLRDHFDSLGIGEYGSHAGEGVHPAWQELSDLTVGNANAISRRGGFRASLEAAQRDIAADADAFRTWLIAQGLADHTPVSELRVGDVVILTGPGWTDRKGQERTIRRVDDTEARFDEGGYANNDVWAVTRKTPAPTAPEAPAIDADTTFDAYHPAMLPMIEKLSKAADDAGYCQEYDRMARSIGAPTRAEVRRLVQERDGAKRQIRYTVPVTVTYVTEDAHQSDEDALSELRAKLGSWPGVIEVISNSIQSGRWDALPVGGSVPDDHTVTVVN